MDGRSLSKGETGVSETVSLGHSFSIGSSFGQISLWAVLIDVDILGRSHE